MLVTELGISTEVKPEHFQKAVSPMLVTELGISTEIRPEQPLKAEFPMLVTELGITTEVKPQLQKADSPMLVTRKLKAAHCGRRTACGGRGREGNTRHGLHRNGTPHGSTATHRRADTRLRCRIFSSEDTRSSISTRSSLDKSINFIAAILILPISEQALYHA